MPADSSAPEPEPDAKPELAAQLGAAARNSAIGKVAETENMSQALLVAMGGWRGLVEAILPGIAFLVLYVVTSDLWLSVGGPAALGLVFVVIRLVRREPSGSAIGGLLGLVLSGFLALRSGEGAQYFVVGFWTNGAYAAALLISMLVRWPLIGVISGFLFGDGVAWRASRRLRWWMQLATGIWVAFFVARLAVQLPLYFANAVEALGVARLVMGAPLFAVVIVVTVLFVRAVYQTASRSAKSGEPKQ
jgi:hypothetical protein